MLKKYHIMFKKYDFVIYLYSIFVMFKKRNNIFFFQ